MGPLPVFSCRPPIGSAIRRGSLPLPLCLAFVLAGVLTAQGIDEKKKEREEPKVAGSATVTVTAEATSIEVAKTPNPVVVLDTEKLSLLGASALDRTLDLALPGRVVGIGSTGGVASLFLNGARSQDVVVMLDGVRVSSGDLGIDMSRFMLSGIGRVEVLSGAASTLYGADAHGGVVSLFSAEPSSQGLSGHVSARTDTLGQARSGASVSYRWDRSWLHGDADLERSPQATETENPYRHASGHIGYGQRLGETSVLTLNYRQHYKGAPIPLNWSYDDWPPSRAYAYNRETSLWQSIATASLKSAFASNFYAEANFGNMGQENYTATDWQPKSTLERFSGNALLAWKQGRGELTAVADFCDDRYWQGEDKDMASTGRHLALAAEGSVEALPTLRLVASARQQWDAIGQYGLPGASLDQATWKAGINFLLPSGFRAYANAGTAFNAPSLYALSLNSVADKPAPGNEQSASIMGGVGCDRPVWWVRADLSRIQYNDLLVYTSAGGEPHFENQSYFRIQGLELSGGMRGGGWSAGLFVRSQEGRDMTQPKESQLRAFMNRPFFSAGLSGDATLEKVRLGLNVSYIGHRYVYSDDLGPDYPEKTHFVDASVYASMQAAKGLAVTLRAERLFQGGVTREDWEAGRDLGRDNTAVLPGYPSPGRTLSIEGRYSF